MQTKKKRPSRRVPDESDVAPATVDAMEVDSTPIPVERDLNVNFVDDDELQAALARSRRVKIKAKKVSPEEIARKSASIAQLQQQLSDSCNSVNQERVRTEQNNGAEIIKVDDGDGPGLIFDDTSEFVRGITHDPVVVKREDQQITQMTAPREPTPPTSVPMDVVEELEAGEVVVKDEEDEQAMLNAIEDLIQATEAEEKAKAANGDLDVGTSTEQNFSTGMASTLTILRQQGILATPSADQTERERIQLQRDVWLASQRRRVAENEMEKLRSRGSNKDQAQREYENRMREQQEARANLEAFKNYKPDVNIVYHDEFGRSLTPKEAWKALSHKFHGKGSGRMKTEKRLKKIAEEKKKEAMISGDTPLGMNEAFQRRQEKTGQAHFVLSVGNRGYVVSYIIIKKSSWPITVPSHKPRSSLTHSPYPKAKRRSRRARKRMRISLQPHRLWTTGSSLFRRPSSRTI